MNKYETVIMFFPDAEEERREKQFDRLKNIITDGSGEITNEEVWGNRKLAYEIQDYQEANYILLEYSADAEIVKELDRIAKISDTVMRHMIIRVDK